MSVQISLLDCYMTNSLCITKTNVNSGGLEIGMIITHVDEFLIISPLHLNLVLTLLNGKLITISIKEASPIKLVLPKYPCTDNKLTLILSKQSLHNICLWPLNITQSGTIANTHHSVNRTSKYVPTLEYNKLKDELNNLQQEFNRILKLNNEYYNLLYNLTSDDKGHIYRTSQSIFNAYNGNTYDSIKLYDVLHHNIKVALIPLYDLDVIQYNKNYKTPNLSPENKFHPDISLNHTNPYVNNNPKLSEFNNPPMSPGKSVNNSKKEISFNYYLSKDRGIVQPSRSHSKVEYLETTNENIEAVSSNNIFNWILHMIRYYKKKVINIDSWDIELFRHSISILIPFLSLNDLKEIWLTEFKGTRLSFFKNYISSNSTYTIAEFEAVIYNSHKPNIANECCNDIAKCLVNWINNGAPSYLK